MVFWDRVTLKMRAKDVLRKSYWVSFGVALVYAIVTGGFSTSSASQSGYRINYSTNWSWDQITSYGAWRTFFGQYHNFPWGAAAAIITGVGLVALVFSVLYQSFFSNIVEIGKNRHFHMSRYNSIRFEDLFFGFKGGSYMSNVKTLFMRDLYTFLWSLAFVIPGIVKSYSYYMMPYILAENPGISTERAFEISMRTTQGEKWEMFVMDLSFIGWYILGIMAFGIGVFFVNPYHQAAKAELYGALRYKAVQTGICTRDEIGSELQ